VCASSTGSRRECPTRWKTSHDNLPGCHQVFIPNI
jgi:hypothetical protein